MKARNVIILLSLISSLSIAQAQVYQTQTIGNTIRSLRMRTMAQAQASERQDPTRVYLTLPSDGIIDGSDPSNTLEISFDELSHDMIPYSYTVYHLNADFTIDDLQSFEYVHGFTRADIYDYSTSLNTRVNYTHYSFAFPNDEMQLLVSGNYLIKIYETSEGEERTVATVVFQVVEPLVDIAAKVTPNTIKEISGRYQQLDIDVNTKSINMVQPENIHLLVRQNGRIDNQVFAPYPNYVEANRLRWKDNSKLVFEGGNEYRHLDIWSTYFAGYNVDRIRYDQQDYHAILNADQLWGTRNEHAGRCGLNYMHEFDHNGQFTINAERCSDIDTEAEYMYVHWTLPMESPIFDGTIYVGGDIFDNRMESTLNRMLYDNDAHCYYLSALLKQGGYDYQYWIKKKSEPSATLLETEGSHWETENKYQIYIYFRSVSDRYDRLVGIYYSSST